MRFGPEVTDNYPLGLVNDRIRSHVSRKQFPTAKNNLARLDLELTPGCNLSQRLEEGTCDEEITTAD